ncbi:MAG: hypothetical protein B7X04_00945 [Parcubacteria group bacterium 21-54-25]|nr:MAG: hypothetical protein B7X04_00945 [Parcubacteria group bacterium 21-54-25]HQU07798.1 serine hydrolase [Candidatus Paceibacterota bacterium]
MEALEFDPRTRRRRIRREAGTALLASAVVLGGFLLLFPRSVPSTMPSPVVVASSTPNAFENLPLHAKAAIVYDLAKHKTLFSKNATAQLPLASITKLLTVYTAVKELGLNAPITITRANIETEGNSGFDPGEVFSLKDLARYTLTGSINDGAAAIAATTATRTNTTIPSMLEASAVAIGLSQTYALDGTGLDSSTMVSGGYGSPRDVALLAGALLKEAPSIASATTHLSATLTSNYGITHVTRNTDQYVTTMPRILLSKTGYTDLAGGNLVVIFDVAFDHPIAVVALGSTEKGRFTDVNTLIAATLAHFAGVSSL